MRLLGVPVPLLACLTLSLAGCTTAPVIPTASDTPAPPTERVTATSALVQTTLSAPPDTPTRSPAPSQTEVDIPDAAPFRRVATLEVPPDHGWALPWLHATPGGALYAVVGRRAYRLDGSQWSLAADEAPAPVIGISPDGQIWAASLEMAAVWDGQAWTEYGADAGWVSLDDITSADSPIRPQDVLFAADGTLWVATHRDVRAFKDGHWRVYSYADMTMAPLESTFDEWSSFTLAEASGMLWVGECHYVGPGPAITGSGARWFDGQAWHGADSPATTGCVTRIARAPDGDIWLDVGPVFYRHDPATGAWDGQRLPKPPDDARRFGDVADLAFDSNGDPWPELTVCGGASCGVSVARYHYAPKSHTFTLLDYQSAGEIFWSVLRFDVQGQGWLFAPENGIYRLQGDRLERVGNVSIPGPDAVAQTPDGALWLLGTLNETWGLWVLDAGQTHTQGSQ